MEKVRSKKNMLSELRNPSHNVPALRNISRYHDLENFASSDVKLEILVLVRVRSLLSLTSFQIDKTFWAMGIAAVEQFKLKANMRREIRPQRLTPESLQTKKSKKK